MTFDLDDKLTLVLLFGIIIVGIGFITISSLIAGIIIICLGFTTIIASALIMWYQPKFVYTSRNKGHGDQT